MAENNHGSTLASFIWKNAEDLWGDFKHTDFGKIILPFTLLRRLECVLEPTRDDVTQAYTEHKDSGLNLDLMLTPLSGHSFYNTSAYTLGTLGSTKTRQNLEDYIAQFSENARVIFEQFDFANTILKMDRAGVLYKICQNFGKTDLHPDVVPDRVMSNIYEHLIRKFGAEVNEAAEDFMTPRDVVRLATALVLHSDTELFEQQPGIIRTIYDQTCGTAGFLSDAISYVRELESRYKVPPKLVPFGQELEPETHAVALTNMMIQGFETKNIKLGSTLGNDQLSDKRFHYQLSNPPFGKKWEKDSSVVNAEHKDKKLAGRFGAGLPRISDGSMLFLLNLVSKLERVENGGGRGAIVLSGSPLFNGGAGSGESEIRRWLLQNDYVDAIVALPTEIFFRTGIGTYIWLLTNNKPESRKGKVQLINATGFWESIKNEGNKRRRISDEQIDDILKIYDGFEPSDVVRIMDYKDFGYRRIKVQRPLRMVLKVTDESLEKLHNEKQWLKLAPEQQAAWNAYFEQHKGQTLPYRWAEEQQVTAPQQNAAIGKVPKALTTALTKSFGVSDADGVPVRNSKGELVADKELTDYENVPLSESIQDYFTREVLPHVPDAWIDESFTDDSHLGDGEVGKVGYEVNFNRYFYKYEPPRPLETIDAELKQVEADIAALLAEVTE